MSARAEVLARIRAANAAGTRGVPAGPIGRAYRQRGELDPAQLLGLLAGRLTDYRALVRRTTADRLADEAAAALAHRGARRIVIPAGLDLQVPAAGVEFVPDDQLPAHVLDGRDGVITTAAVAIAETGTIVLDGSAGQAGGRSRSCPTTTCASCTPARSWRWSARRWRSWPRSAR